ncbi:hypothetical protein CL633_04420 [bacterium]|nr:hypothetical protein [bacterium]
MQKFYDINKIKNSILLGDTLTELKKLPNDTIDTVCTSPPYWGLRSYLDDDHPDKPKEIGLEPTIDEFLVKMSAITGQLKRVLKPTGVMFFNHGDCYGGQRWSNSPGTGIYGNKRIVDGNTIAPKGNVPAKCLALQNYRLIIKMIDEQGWILRNTIIWNKPNGMPSSVKDRFANKYEPVFMLVKNKKYWFDLDAVRVPHKTNEPVNYTRPLKSKSRSATIQPRSKTSLVSYGIGGKNPGDVWRIPTYPFSDAHFATFPPKLIEPMIKAGCPKEICQKCGEARVRVTETNYEQAGGKGREKYDTKNQSGGMETGSCKPQSMKHGRAMEERKKKNPQRDFIWRWSKKLNAIRKTIGWTKCQCKNPKYEAGICLDPFMGSGTTALVARKLGRQYLGIELSAEYLKIIKKRLAQQTLF